MADVAETGRVLHPAEWTALATAHRERADALTAAHRDRAARGETHPVWDFLFTYYSLQPRRLRVWHPGYGTVLAGAAAAEYLDRAGYVRTTAGVTVGSEYLRSRLPTVRFVADLLGATAGRAAQFSCFGLHEWAMVYRTAERRHSAVPLRLGSDGTDAVVESTPLRCSHFDAYRFFTAPAMPRNLRRLSRAGQPDTEQPGCLHANMDLYKWCYKLGALADSSLLLDCLELAFDARQLDMQASPYDLRPYGFDPITVEEPAGRAEYTRRQAVIADRAVPLRSSLLRGCERLLAAAAPPGGTPAADRINALSGREEQ